MKKLLLILLILLIPILCNATVLLNEDFEYSANASHCDNCALLSGWKWDDCKDNSISSGANGWINIVSDKAHGGNRSMLMSFLAGTYVYQTDLYTQSNKSFGTDIWVDMWVFPPYESGKYSQFHAVDKWIYMYDDTPTEDNWHHIFYLGYARYTGCGSWDSEYWSSDHERLYVEWEIGAESPYGQTLTANTYVIVGQWNRIIMHMDTTATGGFESWIDSGSGLVKVADCDRSDLGSHDIGRIKIGTTWPGRGSDINYTDAWIYVDDLKIATSSDDLDWGTGSSYSSEITYQGVSTSTFATNQTSTSTPTLSGNANTIFYGETIEGGTEGGQFASAALDVFPVTTFDANSGIGLGNTMTITKSLALSVIATMEGNNLISAQSALLLSSAITYSDSNVINLNALLTLISQIAYSDSNSTTMQVALNLPVGIGLSDIGSLDLLSSLSLPASMSYNAINTVDFAVSLALSAISTLQESNLITAESAILLTSAVTYSNINTVDMNVLLTLVSQASLSQQFPGASFDVALTLSAISQLIENNSLSRQGELSITTLAGLQGINSLDIISVLSLLSQITQANSNTVIYPANLTLSASADISNINSMVREGIISLVAQGDINAAAQLATYGGLVLQSISQISDSNTIDWNVLLTLSSQASQSYSISGTSIDVIIALSAVAQAIDSGALIFTSDINLTASASIITLLSSVIREGILTLTAQGDINSAAQLSAYGGLILNAMSQSIASNNQDFNVPLILEAVAQAVVTGDMSLLQTILGIEVPQRSFESGVSQRSFGTEVPK